MIIEQRIVAFALGHPGLGPRGVAAQLARPERGGLKVSANGVWKVLGHHGLNTRAYYNHHRAHTGRKTAVSRAGFDGDQSTCARRRNRGLPV
jgi:hypothetical protein